VKVWIIELEDPPISQDHGRWSWWFGTIGLVGICCSYVTFKLFGNRWFGSLMSLIASATFFVGHCVILLSSKKMGNVILIYKFFSFFQNRRERQSSP
jgi:hypothetical protein